MLYPVQYSVSNPVKMKNIANRPFKVSAYGTKPNSLAASLSSSNRFFRSSAEYCSSVVRCSVSCISSSVFLPGTRAAKSSEAGDVAGSTGVGISCSAAALPLSITSTAFSESDVVPASGSTASACARRIGNRAGTAGRDLQIDGVCKDRPEKDVVLNAKHEGATIANDKFDERAKNSLVDGL